MAKPTRPKTKAVKQTSKQKTADRIAMKLDDDTDDPEAEVELDSLGSLFMHLVNNDLPQQEAEASQAEDVEVITLSFGLDSMPTQKPGQTIRKVRFSHPRSLGSNIYFEDSTA